MMLPWWAMTMGTERPAYALVHDFLFRVPVVNNFLMKVGALPAKTRNAERALDAGAGVLIYPGGDLDCYRSFADRNRVDFHGRTGFIELAFRLGVPILRSCASGDTRSTGPCSPANGSRAGRASRP
jgi:1-acyl-sn-glycerol-3-phosphate acyltransferase